MVYVCWVLVLLISLSAHAFIHRSPQTTALSMEDGEEASLVKRLIDERVACRLERRYERADEIKSLLEGEPFYLEIKDYSYKEGGHSTYHKRNIARTNNNILQRIKDAKPELVANTSSFVEELMTLLLDDESRDQDAQEMQGRKFCDAAFELSLLGVADERIFDFLVQRQMLELARWGPRVSVRGLDVVKLLEKAACAGYPRGHAIYAQGAELLKGKLDSELGGDTVSQLLSSPSSFSLSSRRPKLHLWKTLARQHKAGRQHIAPPPSQAPSALTFADDSLPLVVDLGCGLGTSLLGIAERLLGQRAASHNLLGFDLNEQSCRYATGIAHRWGAQGFLQVLCCDCEHGLDLVLEGYPGPVVTIMTLFPTPFRLEADADAEAEKEEEEEEEVEVEGEEEDALLVGSLGSGAGAGNSQLPDKAAFMWSPSMAIKCAALLRAGGRLLLQSNAEDVALFMREVVLSSTALRAPDLPPQSLLDFVGQDEEGQEQQEWAEEVPVQSERQRRFLKANPDAPRAAGRGWLKRAALPSFAQPETEVLCHLDKKPVFAHMFEFPKDS